MGRIMRSAAAHAAVQKHRGDKGGASEDPEDVSDPGVPEVDSREWARMTAMQKIDHVIIVEYTKTRSCVTFPLLLFFWVLFILTQIGHREVDVAYQVQTALLEVWQAERTPHVMNASHYVGPMRVGDIGPAYSEIRSWGDAMAWLEMGAVPHLWGTDSAEQGRVFYTNRVLGGMRVKNTRLEQAACPGYDTLVQFYGKPCYSLEGKRTREPTSEAAELLQGELPDKFGDFVYWLDMAQPMAGVQEHLGALRERSWLSDATTEAKVQAVFYNGPRAVLVAAEGRIQRSMEGTITPKVTLKTLPTVVYGSWLATGDILLSILLAVLFLFELAGLIRVGCMGQGMRRSMKPRHVLNWAVIVLGLGFSIFFTFLAAKMSTLTQTGMMTALINPSAPAALAPSDEYYGSEWEARHALMNDAMEAIFDLASLTRTSELCTFWYSLLLLAKFLQCFEASPRLAVITKTLRKSLGDIIHFGLILAFVFFNFTVCAVFLFGHQLKEWSSLQYGCNSAFRALMGDFDFGPMTAIAPVSATVWFWLFTVLISLIMINMFLAIIMDAYVEVKSHHGKEPALWDELARMSLSSDKFRTMASAVMPDAVERLSPSKIGTHDALHEASASIEDDATSSEVLKELLSQVKEISERMKALDGTATSQAGRPLNQLLPAMVADVGGGASPRGGASPGGGSRRGVSGDGRLVATPVRPFVPTNGHSGPTPGPIRLKDSKVIWPETVPPPKR